MNTTSMPLFPLGSVLFPDGALPLQIFEVRYLNLIKRCVQNNTPFGVVSLLDGNEVRRPGEQISLAKYGTLARVEHFEEVTPALFRIQCIGTQRFELHSAQQEAAGLWMGQIRVLEKDAQVPVPDDLQHTAKKLEELMEQVALQGIPDEQMPFYPPYHFEDCGWVANRWAELMPLAKSTKLQLLVLDNPLLRLELVNDALHAQGMA
ncbi:LON peptidase substrate-binding domain-containing protein [Limnobacter sp.]|uniref:LON peptidase substrate-binding domain-containing protein n=1 Tax=Limnobacter sp. TaxID=2003368 RepID=UPI00351269D9